MAVGPGRGQGEEVDKALRRNCQSPASHGPKSRRCPLGRKGHGDARHTCTFAALLRCQPGGPLPLCVSLSDQMHLMARRTVSASLQVT